MPSILAPSVQSLLERVAKRGLLTKLVVSGRALIAEHDALKASCKKGRTSRAVSSVKKKGREGVLMARSWLLRLFYDLEPDDILVQTTSVGGSDLHFSPKAAKRFPFAPESKRVQSLNIWGALHQAEANAKKKGLKPVLFFSRSNGPLYVAFAADDLAAWLKPRMELSEIAEQAVSQGLDDLNHKLTKDTDGSHGAGSRDQVTPEAG